MAERLNITQLLIHDAFRKTFKTGSKGFFGKAIDPNTGKRYQITAVEIGSKKK